MTGMSIADREQRVRELLQRILGITTAAGMDPVRSETPQWDSLKHMELVFALEDEFGVRFDESEFARLISPAAIARAIEDHLAA